MGHRAISSSAARAKEAHLAASESSMPSSMSYHDLSAVLYLLASPASVA